MMDNMKMAVMTLVTPILTERNMTLMTQTLTTWARTMLRITMMPMQTGMLMPVIMMDEEKSEYDVVNGDSDEDNIEYYAVNGDTDEDGFGADNARTNNAGTENDDDFIDATVGDD